VGHGDSFRALGRARVPTSLLLMMLLLTYAVLSCDVMCVQLPNTRFEGAAFPRICVWAR
jgi:hypothetical protein